MKATALQPKESPADSDVLESKIGYQLRMADRTMSRDFVRDVGMTRVQYSVFSLVATNDGLSQKDVGETLGMDRATTMTLINKLEAAGLVERRVSSLDRRMHALQVTASGRKLFPVINRKVIEHEQRFQNRLTKGEQATFFACLLKIRNG